MAIPKPTSRTRPPGSTKHRKAALAGGGRHGSGAQLPVTCLKDNQPAGLCGWTEQINTMVRALDSCQSEWLAWEATGQAQLLSWTWSQGSLNSEPLPTLLFVLWPLSVGLARTDLEA